MGTIERLQYTNPALPIWREAFAGAEWVRLHMSPTYVGWGVPKGDGEPVVLVPGFMASDTSMLEMRLWLERMGYRARPAGFGRNTGCPRDLAEALGETVEQAYAEIGAPVTLVGHSLGGCLARAVAMDRPEQVAHVIGLGSPVNGARVHPLVLAAGEYVRNGECDETCYLPMQAALPDGVRETCIYSRTDGIVDWRTCAAEGARKVEVEGTHIGLIWNPQVYREIARALASGVEPTAPVGARAPMRLGRRQREREQGRVRVGGLRRAA